jgi:hypothetical protein
MIVILKERIQHNSARVVSPGRPFLNSRAEAMTHDISEK